MKILIFNTLYFPHHIGGAEKSVQLLAEGLVKLGHQTSVLTISNEDSVSDVNGVKVYYIKTKNIYGTKATSPPTLAKPFWHLLDAYNPFYAPIIRKILLAENPEIIHTNNLAGFSVQIWQIAKEFNIPVIHTLRDYYLLCPKSTMYKKGENCSFRCLDCQLYSISKKIMSEHVSAVCGISNFILQKHLNEGYFKQALQKQVIYNTVTKALIAPLGKNSCSSQRKDSIKFGFVGQISPAKGIEPLLKAFDENNEIFKGHSLHIFGKSSDPGYEAYLRATYTRKNIFFEGHQRAEEIYPKIQVVIVPSEWNEPFGRIIIEAYAYGKFVIASNKGGIPEIIKEGVNGFIYDPENSAALVEKMCKIIKNKQLLFEASETNKETARNFSNETNIQAYLNIYSSLARTEQSNS
jgi:glycosyltransferase involved in cell wall biosynthesis